MGAAAGEEQDASGASVVLLIRAFVPNHHHPSLSPSQRWPLSPGYVRACLAPSYVPARVRATKFAPADALRPVCFYQPIGARSLQTSADTTTLTGDASHSSPFTVKLHEDSFRAYQTETPSLEVEVSKEELIGMYKTMTLMRRMEMAADSLYRQKLIRGFCHLATGQVRRHSEPLTRSTF